MPAPRVIRTYDEAVSFLDARRGHGIRPGVERMRALLELMTNPQEAYPSVHVGGTNGKTTTVWMIEELLDAQGLHVGSYTSPHLEHIEDRFRINASAMSRKAFAAAIADVAPFVEIFEERSGEGVTYFETTVATAFQALAAAGVDASVIEVGLGGRLDATNVLDADVSVITGISLDHTTILGDSLGEIAAEKAAILPKGGVLITGQLPAAAEGPVTAEVANTGSSWHRFDDVFGVRSASRAVGGWAVTVQGLHGTYEELFLPLHGRHQVDHLATAIAAAEAFLGHELSTEAVATATSRLKAPGRIEVMRRSPLVIVDGSHNAEGVGGLATALSTEFPDGHRVLVFGIRGSREPVELLSPLAGLFEHVIVTEAADDEAVPVDDLAAAAREVFPGVPVERAVPVSQAVTDALHLAGEEDAVVVAGSLYVVGDARAFLRTT